MYDNVIREDLFRAAVEKASRDEYREIQRKIEESKDTLNFTSQFERRMRSLIRDVRNGRSIQAAGSASLRSGRKARRTLLIAAVLVVISAGTVLAVDPIRVKISEAFVTIFGDHADISTNKTGHEEQGKPHFLKYYPTVIPKGYDVIFDELSVETGSYDLVYENEDGDTIAFSQVASDKISMDLTSDGRTFEKIKIRGNRGYYLTDSEINSVVWSENGYVFTISSELNRRELIKMAEGLEPVK